MPSLEDQLLDVGMRLTAARKRGDTGAAKVLGTQMDRLLDNWLAFYPVPDTP
jgi:hypothetical protein